MIKPALFIGSSSRGLEIARAARASLESVAEVSIWDEGSFPLGQTFIEALVNALRRFDFALLVLTPDDALQSDYAGLFGARDNVIFELGLFTGFLGRERTFALHQANAPIKLPTDLSGVSMATYNWPRGDKNLLAAVSAGCDRIRTAVAERGLSEKKVTQVIGDIRERQREQTAQISKQGAQLQALQFALRGIVTRYEVDKLVGLEQPEPFLCWYSDDLFNEIGRLRAMGFVQNLPGMGRKDFKGKNQQFDLKDFFCITPSGREYLRLRKDVADEYQEAQIDRPE